MRLSLHQMTLGNATPEETVTVAADAGLDFADLFLRTPVDLPYDFRYVETRAHASDIRRMLDDRGIGVFNVDTFLITPETKPRQFEPVLEMAAILGAKAINTVIFEPDRPAALAQLAEFGPMAAGYGVRPVIEWLQMSPIDSLGGAIAFLREAGEPGAGLNADVLHLIRCGGSNAELAAIDPALIGYAQISDGPLVQDKDRLFTEATADRMLPGDGALDLDGFVALLPAGGVLALECPTLRSEEAAFRAEWVRRGAGAMRRLIANNHKTTEEAGQ